MVPSPLRSLEACCSQPPARSRSPRSLEARSTRPRRGQRPRISGCLGSRYEERFDCPLGTLDVTSRACGSWLVVPFTRQSPAEAPPTPPRPQVALQALWCG